MVTSFNPYFDYASIVLFILIFLLFIQQKFVKNGIYWLFLSMLFIAFVTPIFDIMSVYSMENSRETLFYISNTGYYLGQQWNCLLFLFFVLAPLEIGYFRNLHRYFIYSIPVLVTSILIVSNPWNHLVYSYDFVNHSYSYGSLQFICYLPIVIYIIYGFFYLIKHFSHYNVHAKNSLLNVFTVLIACVVIQALVPSLLLHSFSISIAMLILLYTLTKYGSSEDSITGLLDLASLRDKVNYLNYNHQSFKLCFIRIADVDVLISTYGLELTDHVLSQLETNIMDHLEAQTGYKYSRDSLVTIFPTDTDEKGYIRQLKSLLSKDFRVRNIDFSISYFMTVLSYPDDFKDFTTLAGYLDFLSRTSKLNRGFTPISQLDLLDVSRGHDVERAIMNALDNGRFQLLYQPMCISSTRKFVTSEALIRLYDPELGHIGPSEFIPISERTGLIIQVGEFVLESVCKFISSHDMEKLGISYIELNISTVHLLQRDFIPKLMRIIDKYGVSPSNICIEITETAGNFAPETFSENIHLLHQLGFLLALDDFGTGYSNLERLLSLDFNIVKFDKNTTHRIFQDSTVHNAYSKMVSLMHSMGLKVVNEGVENQEMYEALDHMGTDYIQGYFFSKPLTEDEYVEFLNKSH